MTGTYIPPTSTDEHAKTFIRYLQQPTSTKQQNDLWTADELRQAWKRKKEYKSAGKSGLHFGHCKSFMQRPYTAL